MRSRSLTIAVLIMFAMAVILSGCGETPICCDPPPPPLPPPALHFPDTADKLMANFQTVYERMDFGEFGTLMHPDFVTILQAGTIDNFPDLGTTLDVAEETRIHERMFSKQDVTDPVGTFVPGIRTIQFQTLARAGAWSLSLPGDPIPSTECALYDVVCLLDRGPLYSTLKVQGAIRFYVTHRDSTVGGVTRSWYRMLGQLDLTLDDGAKSANTVAWGKVKAFFR